MNFRKSILALVILTYLGAPFAFAENSKRALVVIDMQPVFLQKFNKQEQDVLIQQVKENIAVAKQRGDVIVFVEYKNIANPIPTHSDLIGEVKGYDRFLKVEKNRNDGAREIQDRLKSSGIDLDQIDICGVNTSACVNSTVQSLAHEMEGVKQFSLLSNACNSSDHFHAVALMAMSTVPRVEIMPPLEEYKKLTDKEIFRELRDYLKRSKTISFYVESRWEPNAALKAFKILIHYIEKKNLEGSTSEKIRALLNDPDSTIRTATRKSLYCIIPTEPEVQRLLAEDLKSVDPKVQIEAFHGFARLGLSSQLIPEIHDTLFDLLDDPELGRHAAGVFRKILWFNTYYARKQVGKSREEILEKFQNHDFHEPFGYEIGPLCELDEITASIDR